MYALTQQTRNAYRAGWKRSQAENRADLDVEEDRYLARGRTAAQHDAWVAGWVDYASDYDYGHALTEYSA
jgi:hypothetical protein